MPEQARAPGQEMATEREQVLAKERGKVLEQGQPWEGSLPPGLGRWNCHHRTP